MDGLACGVWKQSAHRRGAADVAVVELQHIVENWLNDVNGWNRIDAVIAPLTLRVTSRTSAEVRRNVWCKT